MFVFLVEKKLMQETWWCAVAITLKAGVLYTISRHIPVWVHGTWQLYPRMRFIPRNCKEEIIFVLESV